jgi:hypothetical protein
LFKKDKNHSIKEMKEEKVQEETKKEEKKSTQVIKKEINKGKVDWSLYKGEPEMSSGFVVYTSWQVGYYLKDIQFEKDEAKFELIVWNYIDEEKSWYKPEAIKGKEDIYLNHEQGRFTFSLLICLELKKKHSKTKFTTEGYEEEISNLFNSVFEEYSVMDDQYNKETDFSRNQEEQLVNYLI